MGSRFKGNMYGDSMVKLRDSPVIVHCLGW